MNKHLLPAYLLTFVNVLGFTILMPILPFIVKDYFAEEWVYGLLITLYSAFQFIGAPYLGAMSDSAGRKPVLLISQAGTLLSWFVFLIALALPDTPVMGLALPLWIIGLSRVLDGITGGNTSVANAYVSDITTREQKSYIFGYLGGIAGLGMIIGPGIGGLAAGSSLGYSGTIYVAIGISIITLISIYLYLKESHPEEKRSKKRRQSVLSSVFVFRRIREVNPSPVIRVIFLVKFFFSTMMAFYIGTIALFVIDLFEFTPKELGQFLFVVGLFLAFNQAVMTKVFIKRFGEFNTLMIGLLLSCLGLIGITMTDNIYIYCSLYYVMNLGLSLCFPTFNSLISIHGNPKKQGEIMGISESLHSLCMAAFPVIAAMLYGYLGYNLYYLIAALPALGLFIAFTSLKNAERRGNDPALGS